MKKLSIRRQGDIGIHKMLHQTTTLIIKAIPDMFHYLDYP